MPPLLLLEQCVLLLAEHAGALRCIGDVPDELLAKVFASRRCRLTFEQLERLEAANAERGSIGGAAAAACWKRLCFATPSVRARAAASPGAEPAGGWRGLFIAARAQNEAKMAAVLAKTRRRLESSSSGSSSSLQDVAPHDGRERKRRRKRPVAQPGGGGGGELERSISSLASSGSSRGGGRRRRRQAQAPASFKVKTIVAKPLIL